MRHKVAIIITIAIVVLSAVLLWWELDNVDLEASEDIYVADSVGYLRHDPFLIPRHHLRKPHFPASPHPFLYQLLQAETLKIFGVSLASVRVLSSLALISSTAILMFTAFTITKSSKIALLSGIIFITFPLTVRFGRMAILDPLFTLWVVLALLWSWLGLHSTGRRGYIFACLTGMVWALAASTKLSGIFIGLPILIIFFALLIKTRSIYYAKTLVCLFISAALFFVVLNDPYSYYFAWTNFSDPKHTNVGLTASIKGLLAFKYWSLFFPTLIGTTPALLALFWFLKLPHKITQVKTLFLLVWFFGLLSYLILNPPHITGLSAEWSYLPLLPVFALIVAQSFTELSGYFKKRTTLLIFIYLLTSLPPLIFYGLRFQPLPLAQYLKARNVVRGNLAVTQIISRLNQEAAPVLVLIQLKSVGFPLWLLRNTISTEPFYHKIYEYQYIVTDDPSIIETAQQNNFIVEMKTKNPTELELWLFRNPNHQQR